jgi:hypothetical protein
LVKVIAFTGIWDRLTGVMYASLQKGTITLDQKEYDAHQFFSNVSNVFIFMVASGADLKALEELDTKLIPHPTDSTHGLAPTAQCSIGGAKDNIVGSRAKCAERLPGASVERLH